MSGDGTAEHDRERAALYQGAFLPQLLVHALSHTPERPVLYTEEGEVYTAGEFCEWTSQYCQALHYLGAGRAARVGILSGNRREVLHVNHACLLNECVLVPLHPRGSVDDYVYIAEHASLDFLVFDPGAYRPQIEELRARAKRVPQLLSLGNAGVGADLCALAARFKPQQLIAPTVHGADLYRLSYSGGTTGRPKAIMGTHEYGASVLAIQLAEWEWPTEVRQLVCAPLSHSGASMFMPTLLRGGCVVLMSGFDPARVLAAIERHRINCVLLVPTMIYALLDCPRLGEFNLSSLETIFYGASSISPARLQEAIQTIGPVFFQFYGQAEAPMTVCVLRRAEHTVGHLRRLSSCGRAVPWVQVELLDESGQPVPVGSPGEICVRGRLVMAGYLNEPEQTAEVFAGGWLHTGDVAVADEDGYLYIVDRKKDMIISGGFNIYPREVEDVLASHPSVAHCAVIGVSDPRWGESVKAVVVLRENCPPCAEELISLVRTRKGAVQAPKSVDFVADIPYTALGKPDKKALRLRYG